MIKVRIIGYLCYVFIVFIIGFFYNIGNPDFMKYYDLIGHLFYTFLSSFLISLILFITDVLNRNIYRKEYVFKKDKVGFFVLFIIVFGSYFVFPKVTIESLLMWLLVVVLGEALRHLYLFYKLAPK